MTTDEQTQQNTDQTGGSETQADEKALPNLIEEIQDGTIESQSDFLFVDKMVNVNQDIVKIVFETPLLTDNVAQRFVKPGTDDSYNDLHGLEELYNEVSAVVFHPSSILDVSIPTDSPVVDPSEQVTVQNGDKSIEKSPFKTRKPSTGDKILGTITVLSTLVSTVFLYLELGIIGIGLNTVPLSIGCLSSWHFLSGNRFIRDSWRRVLQPTYVSEGDRILLAKHHLITNRSGSIKRKELCRVVKVNQKIQVRLKSGETAVLDRDTKSERWILRDIDTGDPINYERIENRTGFTDDEKQYRRDRHYTPGFDAAYVTSS